MCCYCPIRRIIYVHVPKTGGSTIEKILISLYGFKHFTFDGGPYEFLNDEEGQHGFLRYILRYSQEAQDHDLMSFTKFTFVRHPHTRAASCLRYLSESSILNTGRSFETVYDFYEECKRRPFLNVHFIMTQSECIRDLNGEIHMDHIGRFEEFSRELERILFVELALPVKDLSGYHLNKSSPELTVFDANVVNELSNELHGEDFLKFGYSY
jgi:hypothetical protein